MYISLYNYVYLNIFQVQMSSKERSSRPPKKIHDNRYTGSLATTGSELQSQTTLPRSSSAQKPSALQPEPATEWISVIWHSSSGEVCRTVSVSHMSAEWVWCTRVWRSTFLHAGHVVLSWTWKTLMVKTLTCISIRVLPWKQVSVALTKTVDVSWKASKRSSQDR